MIHWNWYVLIYNKQKIYATRQCSKSTIRCGSNWELRLLPKWQYCHWFSPSITHISSRCTLLHAADFILHALGMVQEDALQGLFRYQSLITPTSWYSYKSQIGHALKSLQPSTAQKVGHFGKTLQPMKGWKKCIYDGESWWLCMCSFPFIRLSKCAKQPVHKNGVVTIVVTVGGMMDCVKTSPHYTPHPPIDTVMDVGCPNSFHKKHNLMCEKMRRDEEQCHHMRRCLEDAIQWMKGQTCPQNVQLPLLRPHFVTDSVDTC